MGLERIIRVCDVCGHWWRPGPGVGGADGCPSCTTLKHRSVKVVPTSDLGAVSHRACNEIMDRYKSDLATAKEELQTARERIEGLRHAGEGLLQMTINGVLCQEEDACRYCRPLWDELRSALDDLAPAPKEEG